MRGRLRREVGRQMVGCYSVYITQTFTVISLIDHALYTHIIKPLNIIIIVWTKSVKVALLEKAESSCAAAETFICIFFPGQSVAVLL